jgi:hypothetical protein
VQYKEAWVLKQGVVPRVFEGKGKHKNISRSQAARCG